MNKTTEGWKNEHGTVHSMLDVQAAEIEKLKAQLNRCRKAKKKLKEKWDATEEWAFDEGYF